MQNSINNNYYSKQQLKKMNFKSIGENVKISKNTFILNPEKIKIGNNVRIDAFTTITSNNLIEIGSYVHISCNVYINGADKIFIGDFCGLAAGVKIFSSVDDYSGDYLTNPTIPKIYSNVTKGEIVFEKHVIVGSNSVVLPRVTLKMGSAVGALSLVNKSLESWYIYMGVPARKIKKRQKKILKLEGLI